MALAGNGRWCYLDPKLGAMHAVAEAARKVACTGATPVAATNCLNFGNPEKPEIMAQLSAAIDGIAEACTALGTPITGGNVSLYNETKGEGIYPTPVIGVVGLLDDVSKALPSGFQRKGEAICVVFFDDGPSHGYAHARTLQRDFGCSEFAKTLLNQTWGSPPPIDLHEERELQDCLKMIAGSNLASSAVDIGSGGLMVALSKAGCANGLGFQVTIGRDNLFELFGERASWAIVTCEKQNVDELQRRIGGKFLFSPIGETLENKVVVRSANGKRETLIQSTIAELVLTYSSALPNELAAEVVTG
jgi:phosphoribosylformylglycinamidine synthase